MADVNSQSLTAVFYGLAAAARFVLDERLSQQQRVGVSAALMTVILITA